MGSEGHWGLGELERAYCHPGTQSTNICAPLGVQAGGGRGEGVCAGNYTDSPFLNLLCVELHRHGGL